jgi:hypothetical protein
LSVAVVSEAASVERFVQCLGRFHRLGSRRPKGRTLRQAIVWRQRWVGLVLWCASVWHLEDRDRWIGWDPWRRVERLQLIVHQARFLVLPGSGPLPCASAMLSAASRALPTQWEQRFGYQPLLAETFTDPVFHRGTCYRAANWICVGWSGIDSGLEGRSRKQIWVQELHPQARARLSWMRPAAVHQAGLSRAHIQEGLLSVPLLRSLRRHFQSASLGRGLRPRRHFCGSCVASLLSLGLLRGEATLSALGALIGRLSVSHARVLGLGYTEQCPRTIGFPSLGQLQRWVDQIERPRLVLRLLEWVGQNRADLPASFLRLEEAQALALLDQWRPRSKPPPIDEKTNSSIPVCS